MASPRKSAQETPLLSKHEHSVLVLQGGGAHADEVTGEHDGLGGFAFSAVASMLLWILPPLTVVLLLLALTGGFTACGTSLLPKPAPPAALYSLDDAAASAAALGAAAVASGFRPQPREVSERRRARARA